MTEQPLYNSRLIDTYLKMMKAHYPQVNTDTLLLGIGIEPYEVVDQGRWFTQDQINRFYSAVVAATGNPDIALEAGRYGSSPDALGTMRQYTLSLLGPLKAFSLISKLSGNLTRSADYQTRTINRNSVEVTVTPRNDVKEEPFQCRNRVGFFEAIISIYNYKAPVIKHHECLFKGDSVCRYIIQWHSDSTTAVKSVRNLYMILAGTLNLWLAFFEPVYLRDTAGLSIAGLLGINWWLEYRRKRLADTTLDELRGAMDLLNEQINVNHRNALLTREIGEAITSQSNLDDVLETVIRTLDKILDYDRGLVLLANEKIQRLEIQGAFGYTAEHLDLLENTSFRLDNPNSQGPFVISFRQQKPQLVNDVSKIADKMTARSREFIKALDIRSFLTVPILLESKSIGIIAIENQRLEKPLVNTDVNLLMGIAPSIGVSVRNASQNAARENQFAATLKILAHSIDARDFLTAGHSEEVAEYAVGIAIELGQSHDYCQMIRIASLLHDYGKIGVPDTVLKKNGPLTPEERMLIQEHSKKSYDILSQIPFEGLNKEIPFIALYHHEHWDGAGYPTGLKGHNIPFGARIVAVADFYEAITSKRHYRDPMDHEEALQLLQEESGTHFDPQIVKVFLRFLSRRQKNDTQGPVLRPLLEPAREQRYSFKTKVRANITNLEVNGETLDISQGGVFLQIDRGLAGLIKENATITMDIDLPVAKGVEIKGVVRWVNDQSTHLSDHHPCGLGIAFSELDQNVKLLLQHTVHKLVRSKEAVPLIQPHLEN